MAEENKKVASLEEYLLNAEVDLTYEKPTLMNTEEGLVGAATAWQTSEAGIRAVLESRAMELRKQILFTCKPFEMLPLRERLVEIVDIITLFKSAVAESERRAKAKDADAEQQFNATDEEPVDDTDTNSTM